MSAFTTACPEKFRAATKAMVFMTHVRKRCSRTACNRVITDTISKRFGGKCEKCAGAAK